MEEIEESLGAPSSQNATSEAPRTQATKARAALAKFAADSGALAKASVRQVQVLKFAYPIAKRYQRVHKDAEKYGWSPEQRSAAYKALHEQYAQPVSDFVLKMGGTFVKTAQSLVQMSHAKVRLPPRAID